MSRNVGKQNLACAALAAGATRKEAAGVAGVSERQLGRWLAVDSDFAGRLTEARRVERERVAADWRRARKRAMDRIARLATLMVIKSYRAVLTTPDDEFTMRDAIAAGRIGADLLTGVYAVPPADVGPSLTRQEIMALSDEALEIARQRAEQDTG